MPAVPSPVMSVELRAPVCPTVSPASATLRTSVTPVWPSMTRWPAIPLSVPRSVGASEETLIVSEPGPARIVVTAWRYVLTTLSVSAF